MTPVQLPEVPEPSWLGGHGSPEHVGFIVRGYTAAQLREYATEAVMAERASRLIPCAWTLDSSPHHEIWESACGEAWSFTDGGPEENNVRFCHSCGFPVAITPSETNSER